jgi:transcriptional regulator with PAS, ATPase and Fis domain
MIAEDLCEAHPDCVVVLDADGRVIYINPSGSACGNLNQKELRSAGASPIFGQSNRKKKSTMPSAMSKAAQMKPAGPRTCAGTKLKTAAASLPTARSIPFSGAVSVNFCWVASGNDFT